MPATLMTTSSAAPGRRGVELQLVATSQKLVPSVQLTPAASAAAVIAVRMSSATVAPRTDEPNVIALALVSRSPARVASSSLRPIARDAPRRLPSQFDRSAFLRARRDAGVKTAVPAHVREHLPACQPIWQS